MIDGKRREKVLRDFEKMKKAELVEYAMKQLDELVEIKKQLTEKVWEIDSLEEELRQVKKNDRGAGRKEKFNNEQVQQILKARKEGKSIRVIAKEFNCSAGLVHKLIKSREGELTDV